MSLKNSPLTNIPYLFGILLIKPYFKEKCRFNLTSKLILLGITPNYFIQAMRITMNLLTPFSFDGCYIIKF